MIVAASPHARARVCGVTLVERGRRVAARLGARRILVLDDAAAAAGLAAWSAARDGAELVVVRAGDQVVHVPLVEPLRAADGDRRVAVGPDGAYAGALWARGGAVDEVVAALASDPAEGDRDVAARWRDAGATRVPHGDIARHAATTPAERAGAERMLLRLIDKAEDGPVTKYIYRPVSRPISRLLVRTPVTPNQVSYVVALLGIVGCWFIAQPGQRALVLGSCLVLAGGFLDGCDGEIARLRVTGSKFGAWLDTVVDELTTTLCFVAIGLHAHAHLGAEHGWIAPAIVVGTACYVAAIYGIYYFLIVVSKTGNSQHYVGRLEIVDDAARGVGLRAVATAGGPPSGVARVIAVLSHGVRRDFINLGTVALAGFDLYEVIFGGMLLGGVGTALMVVPEHLRLRGQLRELRRRGVEPRLLPA